MTPLLLLGLVALVVGAAFRIGRGGARPDPTGLRRGRYGDWADPAGCDGGSAGGSGGGCDGGGGGCGGGGCGAGG